MRKKVLLILFILTGFTAFSQNMNIGLLNGPSCIPCAKLMEDSNKIDETKVEYEIFASPQDLLPKMIKKEIDIGFMPVNVAAKCFKSTKQQIICVAITGEGNLALISKDSKLSGFSDLKGSVVYVAGAGATPEYITKYILKMENIPVDSTEGITLDFSIPTNQLVPQFLAGKIDNIIVPEPFVTLVAQNLKQKWTKIDLQKKYFNQYFVQNYPLTVMVVRKEFAEENPHLMNQFLEQYENALKWTIANPAKSGELCEKYELGLKKEIVEKAIPQSNYVYIPSIKGKMIIESLLGIIMDNDTSFLDGILPSSDFYYTND